MAFVYNLHIFFEVWVSFFGHYKMGADALGGAKLHALKPIQSKRIFYKYILTSLTCRYLNLSNIFWRILYPKHNINGYNEEAVYDGYLSLDRK